MNTDWDKNLVVRDDKGNILAVIMHDIPNRKKIFLKVEEMSMDEIKEILCLDTKNTM